MAVKKVIQKGEYSDRDIIDLMNSLPPLKNILKTIGEFKTFGRMLKAKLAVKNLSEEAIITLAKNRP